MLHFARIAGAILGILVVSITAAFADDWVAVKLRGEVVQLVGDQWLPLKRNDVVSDDRAVRTGFNGHVVFSLPLDKIKIDQSFVRRLPADQEAIAIVRSVTELGRALGKEIVAEGIETADQAWLLKLMGCRTGQGYHFARPLDVSGIAALLMPRAAMAIPA